MISKLIKRQFSTAGSLLTWGQTTFGWGRQPNNKFYVPAQVQGFHDVTHIASGPYHLLFTTQSDEVFATGLGDNGRLGNKSTTSAETPQSIDYLKGLNVKQLAAGEKHSLALTEKGDVYSWGYGGRTANIFNYVPLLRIQSPLGLGDTGDVTEPTLVEQIQDVSQLTAGHNLSVAVKKDGKVYGWGDNIMFLGGRPTSRPEQLEEINYFLHKNHSNVVKVSTVGVSSFFLLENGRIYVIGRNSGGCFGTRNNPRVIEDNRLRVMTKIVDEDFKGEKITNFEVSNNSLIFTTDSGSVFYTGMSKKYRPQRFPSTQSILSIFATHDSVGVIGKDGSVSFINDQFIENSVIKGNLIVSRDPLLNKTLKIGGTHRLRYALVSS